MSDSSKSLGCFDILAIGSFLILLTLKLIGAVAFSWWVVFSPLIILAGFYILVIVFAVVMLLIAKILENLL